MANFEYVDMADDLYAPEGECPVEELIDYLREKKKLITDRGITISHVGTDEDGDICLYEGNSQVDALREKANKLGFDLVPKGILPTSGDFDV